MQKYTNAEMYVDRFTGKQYLVQKGYSGSVQQFAPGVTVYFDGSCCKGGKTGQQVFKNRKDLNSWLRMMGFKK